MGNGEKNLGNSILFLHHSRKREKHYDIEWEVFHTLIRDKWEEDVDGWDENRKELTLAVGLSPCVWAETEPMRILCFQSKKLKTHLIKNNFPLGNLLSLKSGSEQFDYC